MAVKKIVLCLAFIVAECRELQEIPPMSHKDFIGRRHLTDVLCCFMLFLLLDSTVFAWSSAGHMVIAAEAWYELSPGQRNKVTELLKSHPEYGKWEGAFQGDATLDLATYVFMRASAWPDEIRRYHSKFDHPHWHYINHP